MKQLCIVLLLINQFGLAGTSAAVPYPNDMAISRTSLPHMSAWITRPDTVITPSDSLRKIQLNDVVVTASRVPESLLKAPVSIELLDARQIRMSAQPSYFDAIENLKGVQLLTSSLGFKVYNTRGFANPTNVRFVQLVDGMDNQAPHIGAPIANALAPSDLDIQRVEVVPGASSALYGLNALNGLVQLITKDPFTSPGLSISQKTGINHVDDALVSAKAYSETSLRYAHAFGGRFALKMNLTYQRGYDWIAHDLTDLNPNANTALGLTSADNPGRDLVNNYGDESANRRTLTLAGKRYVVARTGYLESESADLTLNNLRGDVALYWRIRPNLTVSYNYKAATLDNVYQRTNRFRLDDYRLDQHGLTLESPSVHIRAYRTHENTGNSYNIRSMAENIDKSFKSDNQWFTDFSNQFLASSQAGQAVATALQTARATADQGRPQPVRQCSTNRLPNCATSTTGTLGQRCGCSRGCTTPRGRLNPRSRSGLDSGGKQGLTCWRGLITGSMWFSRMATISSTPMALAII